MSCCNQPPKGGTSKLGLLVKVTLIMALSLFVIAALFG